MRMERFQQDLDEAAKNLEGKQLKVLLSQLQNKLFMEFLTQKHLIKTESQFVFI